MAYILRSSTVIRRHWFSGAVTGTPTAQLYVSGVASGGPIAGTGVDDAWVFSVPVSALAFGTSVEIWASGLVGAVTERVKLVDGFIADTTSDLGDPLVGPFTRTITVTDSVSGDPIEGVSVRLSLAADTESQLTNASGVASFTVSAGTWSYDVFRSGYAGTSGTIVVTENGATTIVLVIGVSNTLLEDVYRIFGMVNARRWADLDGNQNVGLIESRISATLDISLQYTIDRIGATYDTVTLLQSAAVRDMIARMAGISIYQSRGYEDDDNKLIAGHQKQIDAVLKLILTGRLKFPGVARTTAHPDVSS